MTTQSESKQRNLRRAFVVYGALLLLLAALVGGAVVNRLQNMGRGGYYASSVAATGPGGQLTFVYPFEREFPEAPAPRTGDTLLAIEGVPVNGLNLEDLLGYPVEVNDTLSVTYLREGRRVEAPWVAHEVNPGYVYGQGSVVAMYGLLAVMLIGLGLLAVIQQGIQSVARVFALFCYTLGGLFVFLVEMTIPGPLQSFALPGLQSAMAGLYGISSLFSGAWLHLAFLFPFPNRMMQRRRWLVYLLAYAPLLPTVVFSTLFNEQYLMMAAAGHPLAMVTLPIGAIQVLWGIVLLWRKRRHPDATPLHRRQLKVVTLGAGMSLLLMLLIGVGFLVFREQLGEHMLLVALVSLVFILVIGLIPLSFVYAMGRYRLLEAELRLRRGTRFLLVTGLLFLVFFGVLYAVSEALLKWLEVDTRGITLVVAFALALGFAPLHRRLREWVENLFYPERAKLRRLLEDFLSATASLPDRASLWTKLEDRLQEGLGIERLHVFEHDGAGVLVEHAGRTRLSMSEHLRGELERRGAPLLVSELLQSERHPLPDELESWLRAEGAALLLPLVLRGTLTGVLALVYPRRQESLAPEDLDLLRRVAVQVAREEENLRLLEENLEKRRLEEQLAMARQVQERFLPRELPDVHRLRIGALCLPSLEVAGDYYDVVPIGRRTLLAVGDVSGKGAGAAMLMANLQASLRSLAGVEAPLDQVVARMNRLVFQNTDPEQYVTFFVAVVDPAGGTLEYVNAGHNPPMLLRGTEVHELNRGGVILGVIEDSGYSAERLAMDPGDRLVLFTDGVTEAMNPAGEEYGEQRLREALVSAEGEQPRDTVQRIWEQVRRHAAADILGDDFTLVVAELLE